MTFVTYLLAQIHANGTRLKLASCTKKHNRPFTDVRSYGGILHNCCVLHLTWLDSLFANKTQFPLCSCLFSSILLVFSFTKTALFMFCMEYTPLHILPFAEMCIFRRLNYVLDMFLLLYGIRI